MAKIGPESQSGSTEFAPHNDLLVAKEFVGCPPLFPQQTGETLTNSLDIIDLRHKRLIFNRLSYPGQVHVYRADCRAGERLRIQSHVPMLPLDSAVVPAFAVVGQSLPYSADVEKLPLELPAGYSAVVAPPPTRLVVPVIDVFTRARLYPGPVIDTRTLVGGHCYLVVWSPHNHMGKYVLQVGHARPWHWTYWLQTPRFWWLIRGWFGLSRAAAYVVGAVLIVLLWLALIGTMRRSKAMRRKK